MPSKNSLKRYGEYTYYHVYNRGAGKQEIFRDNDDYVFMLSLFKRFLSISPNIDRFGRVAPNYHDSVELIAYCLMPNHYHFLLYLKERDGIEKFMRSMMTTYSMYFNRKYDRSGTLFQGPFKAIDISDEAYFWHISRYIHLNPIDISGADYLDYPYSSIMYYTGEYTADWIHPEKQVETASERNRYIAFLADYEDYHHTLKNLRRELADS